LRIREKQLTEQDATTLKLQAEAAAYKKNDALARGRLAIITNQINTNEAELKRKGREVKARDKELKERGALVSARTKELKHLSTEAESARKVEEARAATRAKVVAEFKGQLALAASQAEGKIKDMEVEHSKAMDRADVRVRKLVEKISAETESQLQRSALKGRGPDMYATDFLNESVIRTARSRDLEYATWFMQQR